jgi:hypothetical protein
MAVTVEPALDSKNVPQAYAEALSHLFFGRAQILAPAAEIRGGTTFSHGSILLCEARHPAARFSPLGPLGMRLISRSAKIAKT